MSACPAFRKATVIWATSRRAKLDMDEYPSLLQAGARATTAQQSAFDMNNLYLGRTRSDQRVIHVLPIIFWSGNFCPAQLHALKKKAAYVYQECLLDLTTLFWVILRTNPYAGVGRWSSIILPVFNQPWLQSL